MIGFKSKTLTEFFAHLYYSTNRLLNMRQYPLPASSDDKKTCKGKSEVCYDYNQNNGRANLPFSLDHSFDFSLRSVKFH